MVYQKKDRITLKWGTLKEWEIHSQKCKDLLVQYTNLGSSMSAMLQQDTQEQKDLICKIIDASTGKRIYLDWDGRYASKDEAKKYVLEYGKSK